MTPEKIKEAAEAHAETTDSRCSEAFPFLVAAFMAGYAAAQPKKAAFDCASMPLPQWLPRGAWQDWCAHRKETKKAITKRSAVMQIDKLHQYMHEGHSPASVIKNSIAGGYQGLFPPKSGSQEPGWRKEQRERTQIAAPGVAAGSMPAVDFFEAETRRLA